MTINQLKTLLLQYRYSIDASFTLKLKSNEINHQSFG